MKMPKQESRRGFTLLETMVSMAIGLSCHGGHGQPVQDGHGLRPAGLATG